jgi:hypothetical protein
VYQTNPRVVLIGLESVQSCVKFEQLVSYLGLRFLKSVGASPEFFRTAMGG